MNHSDNMLLKYLKYLPTDLIRYTKPYLPMSIVKTVRKLHRNEFPLNYLMCKDLNDFFYKKYISCDIEIKHLERSITLLRKKQLQNKRNTINTFSMNFWQDPFTNDTCINREIEKTEQQINTLTQTMGYYYPIYCQSTTHLQNFKIVELE